jgi:hypothetical protein
MFGHEIKEKKNTPKWLGARWWIVDIPIAYWQPTTPKKEDQRTPKGTHGIP